MPRLLSRPTSVTNPENRSVALEGSSLVVLGYPAEQVPAEDRYRPERVHHNRWSQKGG